MAVAAKKRTSSPKNSVAAARAGKTPRSSGASAGGAWETAKSIAGMLLIFLVFRAFFVEAFRIPSGSMVPTLLVGDWLFVNKLRYGPHVPFTNVSLPGYAEPKRGEVVVFESPYQADEAARGDDPTPTLVKRLVALPGDTIYMRRGVLYVDGIAQRPGYAASADPAASGGSDPNEVSDLFDWQKQFALRNSRFGPPPAQPTHDDWGPLVVPSRRYMMLGDNRYNSKDSRYWGLVPRENIRGRPLFVYYSYDPDCDRGFCPLLGIRAGRIGHQIR